MLFERQKRDPDKDDILQFKLPIHGGQAGQVKSVVSTQVHIELKPLMADKLVFYTSYLRIYKTIVRFVSFANKQLQFLKKIKTHICSCNVMHFFPIVTKIENQFNHFWGTFLGDFSGVF